MGSEDYYFIDRSVLNCFGLKEDCFVVADCFVVTDCFVVVGCFEVVGWDYFKEVDLDYFEEQLAYLINNLLLILNFYYRLNMPLSIKLRKIPY